MPAPLTHHARVRMQQRGIPCIGWCRLERYFDTYAVVGPDDGVITVGHRSRRSRES